jgi:DnaJ family protein C protein 7
MVIGLLCSRATALAAIGRYIESAADCCRAEKLTLPSGSSCPRAIDLRAEAFSLMGAFDLASDDLTKLWQISTSSIHHHTSRNAGIGGASSGRHPAAPAIVARLQDARRAAADSGSSRNHYAILGVKSSATASEIKSAYRALALRLHPDKAAEALGHETATLLFSLLSAAHATLGNTQSRRAYDLQLLRQKYVNGNSSSGDMGSYGR